MSFVTKTYFQSFNTSWNKDATVTISIWQTCLVHLWTRSTGKTFDQGLVVQLSVPVEFPQSPQEAPLLGPGPLGPPLRCGSSFPAQNRLCSLTRRWFHVVTKTQRGLHSLIYLKNNNNNKSPHLKGSAKKTQQVHWFLYQSCRITSCNKKNKLLPARHCQNKSIFLLLLLHFRKTKTFKMFFLFRSKN